MAQWQGITVTKEIAEKLKEFLREEPAVLDFEPSGCYENVHIEINTELPIDELCNKFVDWLAEKERSAV